MGLVPATPVTDQFASILERVRDGCQEMGLDEDRTKAIINHLIYGQLGMMQPSGQWEPLPDLSAMTAALRSVQTYFVVLQQGVGPIQAATGEMLMAMNAAGFPMPEEAFRERGDQHGHH